MVELRMLSEPVERVAWLSALGAIINPIADLGAENQQTEAHNHLTSPPMSVCNPSLPIGRHLSIL